MSPEWGRRRIRNPERNTEMRALEIQTAANIRDGNTPGARAALATSVTVRRVYSAAYIDRSCERAPPGSVTAAAPDAPRDSAHRWQLPYDTPTINKRTSNIIQLTGNTVNDSAYYGAVTTRNRVWSDEITLCHVRLCCCVLHLLGSCRNGKLSFN